MADLSLVEILALQVKRKETYKLEYYQPYGFQKKFHHAIGHRTQKLAVLRALMCANQIGKSMGGCMEDAMHLTGRYPDWWEGHRFARPVNLLASGVTNDSVRDILQAEICGDPTDDRKLGTGTIPIDCIGKFTRKAGVQNAFDSIRVKHVSGGWSKCFFRAYEQGFKKFQGVKYDVVHADEEPPDDVWQQMVRSMFSRKDAASYITFTPEEGMTQVVTQFVNDLQEGQSLITAGWRDAPHMMNADGTLTDRARILMGSIPAHARAMRIEGTPLMGAGLVFPVAEEQIVIDPIEIPRHWPQIIGLDFGWDHPTAAGRIAYDRDNDCIYVTADYRASKEIPVIHCAAIKAWGDWIPVAWPHDGMNTEKGTGEALIDAYRKGGLNCLPWKATNPPQIGQIEGEGGNSVEASIMEMLSRMETGRLKIFKTCTNFIEERRMYHRDKNGKIVKLNDDTISAIRMACMMVRHARTVSVKARPQKIAAGHSNWR